MRANKKRKVPFPTIAQVIVHHLVTQSHSKSISLSSSSSSSMNIDIKSIATMKSTHIAILHRNDDDNNNTMNNGVKRNENDIRLVDINDDDHDDDDLCIPKQITRVQCKDKYTAITSRKQRQCESLDMNTLLELRVLLIGRESSWNQLTSAWTKQGFTFSQQLSYGLIQHQGGPCGLLAVVQAEIIRHLNHHHHTIKPTLDQQRSALLQACVTILSRCASHTRTYCVVLPLHSSTRHELDWSHERWINLQRIQTEDINELYGILEENMSILEASHGCGALLVVLSAMMCRGLDNIYSDCDYDGVSMIGAHGYCTQEMVNLLITGRATSNVFNGVDHMESSNNISLTLTGVHSRMDIGFLSLFEHYGHIEVGSFLKDPFSPIWVVCSESHYTVLFMTDTSIHPSSSTIITLYYYDQLGNQHQTISLCVQLNGDVMRSSCPPKEGALIPPIDHCIRTKWKDAIIIWENVDPLL